MKNTFIFLFFTMIVLSGCHKQVSNYDYPDFDPSIYKRKENENPEAANAEATEDGEGATDTAEESGEAAE